LIIFNTNSVKILNILENNLGELNAFRISNDDDNNLIKKVVKIFNNSTYNNFIITNSNENSLTLKTGEYDIELNLKEDNNTVKLMHNIIFNPANKKTKYGAIQQQVGEKHFHRIFCFIYTNLDENELYKECIEKYNNIIESDKKAKKVTYYVIFTSAIAIIGFFLYFILSNYFTTTTTACNGWSKRTADNCYDFDWSDPNNKKMTISMKDYHGEWETKVTHSYVKKEKSIKYKGEMLDKLITKDLTGFAMTLVMDGDKIYRLSIGGQITDTYYYQ